MKELKEGDYYINLANQSLRSINNNEDFTDMIDDFSKFSYLGIRINGDTIRLINSPIRGFIFVCYPSVDGRYIRLNDVIKFKEEENMSKVGTNNELSPEERIEQLEKEKAALEMQIKKQAKYDEFRKAGDDLALAVKALQDSGFSRNEAMQIFMMTSMNTMILPFLRR